MRARRATPDLNGFIESRLFVRPPSGKMPKASPERRTLTAASKEARPGFFMSTEMAPYARSRVPTSGRRKGFSQAMNRTGRSTPTIRKAGSR
ncbi:MAG: hypothetical protein FD126_2026 [Elusimicrobia bacterium]|nr:MAG: hypothetical protein FD126_2026 [Elusimicrobiota bacterium]